MGADFINALHDETAQADAVGLKLHARRDFNFVKCDGFSVGERGSTKLTARGGDAAFVIAGEREIMRLRKHVHAGKQLRQEFLPVLAAVGLLKLGLAVRWIHLGVKDSDKMICGNCFGSTAAASGAGESASFTSSG